MRLTQPRSIQRLWVAACALAVAFSLGTIHAAEEADVAAGIQRYCATSWRNAGIASQDWENCTQEVFVLLLEHVPRHRWSRAIHVARSAERRVLNRAIWRIEQRWRRSRKHVPSDRLQALPCEAQQREWALAELREEIDRTSRALLKPRQQRILSLIAEGWSISEIAAELQISPARVSDEKYKAIRKLRQSLNV